MITPKLLSKARFSDNVKAVIVAAVKGPVGITGHVAFVACQRCSCVSVKQMLIYCDIILMLPGLPKYRPPAIGGLILTPDRRKVLLSMAHQTAGFRILNHGPLVPLSQVLRRNAVDRAETPAGIRYRDFCQSNHHMISILRGRIRVFA